MDILKRSGKADLAYIYTPPTKEGEALPIVMFLGGYRSDMRGTKAEYLEQVCAARGQGYVRFDYGGHGESEGLFEDGTIGSWHEDSLAIFDHIQDVSAGQPVVAVGSSMGGWMALLLALARPQQLAGLVGIAAAPDFTQDLYDRLDEAGQKTLQGTGQVAIPNDYSDEPYIFTKRFHDESLRHFVLGRTARLPFPVKLVQGKRDLDVPWQTAERIKDSFRDTNIELIFVEDGDHRLSRPQDLILIDEQIVLLS